MSTPKPIQIAIEAIVKGQRNVDELANDLRALSGVLDDELSEHAKEAAEALDALGAKQRALESFKELGTQTRDLSVEFRKAQDDAKRLGTELKTEAAAAKPLQRQSSRRRPPWPMPSAAWTASAMPCAPCAKRQTPQAKRPKTTSAQKKA